MISLPDIKIALNPVLMLSWKNECKHTDTNVIDCGFQRENKQLSRFEKYATLKMFSFDR